MYTHLYIDTEARTVSHTSKRWDDQYSSWVPNCRYMYDSRHIRTLSNRAYHSYMSTIYPLYLYTNTCILISLGFVCMLPKKEEEMFCFCYLRCRARKFWFVNLPSYHLPHCKTDAIQFWIATYTTEQLSSMYAYSSFLGVMAIFFVVFHQSDSVESISDEPMRSILSLPVEILPLFFLFFWSF